ICFIVPGLVIILGLSVLFLEHSPPDWVTGAAAGAGASVPAIAVAAAAGLVPASRRRAGAASFARVRWACYLAAGCVSGNVAGAFVVVVLLACGLAEWLITRRGAARTAGDSGGSSPRASKRAGADRGRRPGAVLLPVAGKVLTAGVFGSLAWVALKVG